jgi:sugar O-acyltransferase (sialic acid O-acetyltransferase NeuD family)
MGFGTVTDGVVIVGCGGHGREALGIVCAINEADPGRWRPIGFVDDQPSATDRERVDRLGVPLLGPIEWLAEEDPATYVVLGIGDPGIRREVDRRVVAYGRRAATLVHPAATVGRGTITGEGLLAFAGARVTTNVTLGRHVHLNQNVTIGHDCVLEDYVSVNPLAAVSGSCRLDSGVMIGANAAVLQNLTIGASAIVGAGACVVRDVPPGAVVKGVPAR